MQIKCVIDFKLKTSSVGGFNPLEKYARQVGSSPQVGVKIYKKNETTTESFVGSKTRKFSKSRAILGGVTLAIYSDQMARVHSHRFPGGYGAMRINLNKCQ